jgi:hypothetical protein
MDRSARPSGLKTVSLVWVLSAFRRAATLTSKFRKGAHVLVTVSRISRATSFSRVGRLSGASSIESDPLASNYPSTLSTVTSSIFILATAAEMPDRLAGGAIVGAVRAEGGRRLPLASKRAFVAHDYMNARGFDAAHHLNRASQFPLDRAQSIASLSKRRAAHDHVESAAPSERSSRPLPNFRWPSRGPPACATRTDSTLLRRDGRRTHRTPIRRPTVPLY